MSVYIGLIHKARDSEFGVSFPDFPGVITAGETLDEALRMAQEALSFHVEGIVEDGEIIPAPSTLEEVYANREDRPDAVILVPLMVDVLGRHCESTLAFQKTSSSKSITMPRTMALRVRDF